MSFRSFYGRHSHEVTDLIHYENMARGYRSEGIVTMQCRRCDELLFISRWSDHEIFGRGHKCCHVCELDFPHVGALKGHIERFKSDGRHEWVCRKEDCQTVCRSEEGLEDHCNAWAEHKGHLYDEHASFQCKYCKKILGGLPLWQEHMKSAHLDVLNEYELPSESEETGNIEEGNRWWYDSILHRLVGCRIV